MILMTINYKSKIQNKHKNVAKNLKPPGLNMTFSSCLSAQWLKKPEFVRCHGIHLIQHISGYAYIDHDTAKCIGTDRKETPHPIVVM